MALLAARLQVRKITKLVFVLSRTLCRAVANRRLGVQCVPVPLFQLHQYALTRFRSLLQISIIVVQKSLLGRTREKKESATIP